MKFPTLLRKCINTTLKHQLYLKFNKRNSVNIIARNFYFRYSNLYSVPPLPHDHFSKSEHNLEVSCLGLPPLGEIIARYPTIIL